MKLSFVQKLSLQLLPVLSIAPAVTRKNAGDLDDLDSVRVFGAWSTSVKPGANGFAAFARPGRSGLVVRERAAASHERTRPVGPAGLRDIFYAATRVMSDWGAAEGSRRFPALRFFPRANARAGLILETAQRC